MPRVLLFHRMPFDRFFDISSVLFDVTISASRSQSWTSFPNPRVGGRSVIDGLLLSACCGLESDIHGEQ